MDRIDLARSGPWVGWAGIVCLLWMTGASALFAPWWGIALMVTLWLLCTILVLGWTRIHPIRTIFVPLIGVVLWFVLALCGAYWWGWGN